MVRIGLIISSIIFLYVFGDFLQTSDNVEIVSFDINKSGTELVISVEGYNNGVYFYSIASDSITNIIRPLSNDSLFINPKYSENGKKVIIIAKSIQTDSTHIIVYDKIKNRSKHYYNLKGTIKQAVFSGDSNEIFLVSRTIPGTNIDYRGYNILKYNILYDSLYPFYINNSYSINDLSIERYNDSCYLAFVNDLESIQLIKLFNDNNLAVEMKTSNSVNDVAFIGSIYFNMKNKEVFIGEPYSIFHFFYQDPKRSQLIGPFSFQIENVVLNERLNKVFFIEDSSKHRILTCGITQVDTLVEELLTVKDFIH